MATPILTTKLYIPPTRPKAVQRPCLIELLNEGLSAGRKLTLVSAPAGFGKTTLVSAWIAGCGQPVAWLSLDEGDSDPTCFLTYLVAALQTLAPDMGAGALVALQSPQPPPIESLLTVLLNEIAAVSDAPSAGSGQGFILALDDYHVIDSPPVDQALVFLLEHLPPQMHLVIATREDPSLPLARLRARNQLTELRAADLRFTPAEAAEFLNQVMGLNLAAEDIAALETRTEGWIAGLQLAAISMQGHHDAAGFIKSFTGSHHFVLDYLIEEVLHQQSENIQTFLLRTSILERMCGPLCDAVVRDPAVSGQVTLEYLEHANLFIVPLDHERHWYRYHHLFGDLLRKRLGQSLASPPLSSSSSGGTAGGSVAELHIRASQWYEDEGLEFEAFHHAAAANDVERAARLMESKGMPLHLPGVATVILNWLESLPRTFLDARPALWWKQASLMLVLGLTTGVEEKLQAAEAALASAIPPCAELDDTTRNLIGKIAVARANLAQTQAQAEVILVQARRALEYLHPNNLSYRSSAIRAMGFAYYWQGDWAEANRAYTEALSLAHAAGDTTNALLASIRLGQIQELENQLHLAAETYQRVLQLIGDYSPPNSPVAYLGLARICYEWNDLNAAEQYGEKSLQMARRYDQVIDRLILSELFLAQLKLAQRDAIGAARILSQTEQVARQKMHTLRLPDIAATQALIHLYHGDTDAAAQLVQQYDLPLHQARVLIAQDNPSAALAVLVPFRQQMEVKGAENERLRALVLQALALHRKGEKALARQALAEALALAEPGGFIRLFVDKGEPMRLFISDFRLWIEKQSGDCTHPQMGYVDKLLAAFAQPEGMPQSKINYLKTKLIEPLSQRELEVLGLIAQGLSNQEIGQRLFLALDTVKGHNRRIFDKLQVQRRTEAIARAHELGLL
ncbi:MAG TPA: LuxR C-terminal-related transcriptional regulator [Anaerolineae bacterium]|nr:LuxR C-terminal-related transcriptional regulator [Anaerolineae bacterium]